MITICFLSQLTGGAWAQPVDQGGMLVQYDRLAAEQVSYQHVADVPFASRESLIRKAFAAIHADLSPEAIELVQFNPTMGRLEAIVWMDVTPAATFQGTCSVRLQHRIAVTAIKGTYKLELTEFRLFAFGFSAELEMLLASDDGALEELMVAQQVKYDYRRAMLLQTLSGRLEQLVGTIQDKLEQSNEGVVH